MAASARAAAVAEAATPAGRSKIHDAYMKNLQVAYLGKVIAKETEVAGLTPREQAERAIANLKKTLAKPPPGKDAAPETEGVPPPHNDDRKMSAEQAMDVLVDLTVYTKA